MDKKYIKMYTIEFVILAALIVVSQLVTYLIMNGIGVNGVREVIPGVLELRYAENRGMAFSFLYGRTVLLSMIAGVMCLGILGYLIIFKKEHRLLRTGLVILLAGAVSNLYERVFAGFVIDYFFITFYPAVFNVADILIVAGAILVGIYVVFYFRKESKKEKAAKSKASEK